jgi:hypothetical protein
LNKNTYVRVMDAQSHGCKSFCANTEQFERNVRMCRVSLRLGAGEDEMRARYGKFVLAEALQPASLMRAGVERPKDDF